MYRSLLVAAMVAIAGHQAADSYTVSKAPRPDVNQEILQVVDAQSRRTAEVFPGSHESSIGAAVVSRIQSLMDRVDEADRNALIANKATAGFDRSILKWRAHANGQRVVLAVRYYREPLFRLELEMTDDYGRADPVDPARYEFFAITVCSRGNTGGWTCNEEQLTDVAGRHKLPLPQTRAERTAAAETLVDLVLAGK